MKTFKKLNCHPKKTRKNNTCYDNKTIMELKLTWNKKNKDKITSTNPNNIWTELKKKIKNCKHEVCWLDHIIKEKKYIKKIKKENFVPDAPLDEWKKYNNWLSSTEFDDIMKQYQEVYPHFLYLGPSPIDFDTRIDGKCVWPTLCNLNMAKEIKRGKTKIGIVLNLDKHNGKGSHWVAIFIDIKKKFIFYFESTGQKVPKEVIDFNKRIIEQCSKLNIKLTEYNNLNIRHQYGSSECGMYVLYFIISLLLETRTAKHFLGARIADSEVDKLRDVYFNKL
jgi:hypothetical protein